MYHMKCCILAINQVIIKVHHHKFTNEKPQNLIHEMHEGPKSIRQTKSMTSHSYNPYLALKAIFHSSPFLHPNLVVSTFKVNLRENLRPMKLIKHIIQSGDRKLIFDGNVVYGLRIHRHMPSPIFRGHQKSANQTKSQVLRNCPTLIMFIYLIKASLCIYTHHDY